MSDAIVEALSESGLVQHASETILMSVEKGEEVRTCQNLSPQESLIKSHRANKLLCWQANALAEDFSLQLFPRLSPSQIFESLRISSGVSAVQLLNLCIWKKLLSLGKIGNNFIYRTCDQLNLFKHMWSFPRQTIGQAVTQASIFSNKSKHSPKLWLNKIRSQQQMKKFRYLTNWRYSSITSRSKLKSDGE